MQDVRSTVFEKAVPIILFAIFVFIYIPFGAYALEPDEILLVVNSHSKDSRHVADYYVRRRGVPKENIFMVQCTKAETISRHEYNNRIALPIKRALEKGHRSVKIRCILLTKGIPLKIRADKMNHEESLSAFKIKERIKALEQLVEQKRIGPDLRRSYQGKINALERRLRSLDHSQEVASVDSELFLVKRANKYKLSWWQPNPLFLSVRARDKIPIRPSGVLMVSRLDGPDLKTTLRIIDDSCFAEKNGLRGVAYFDCRYPKLPASGLSAYEVYDKWLRLAAKITDKMGVKTVLDTSRKLFGQGSCPNAVLYCGWYSLAKYVDAFSWKRGAVAYHIASSECVGLHKGGTQWCPMLLERGACVTLGPVAEPYVQAFPPPQIFFRLLFDPQLTIAEVYLLSCPYLSWRMVLLADPLYRPSLALGKNKKPSDS